MRICVISGSARQNNNTLRVARAVKHLLEPNHRVSLIDFVQYDLPLLAQGHIDLNNLSLFQQTLFDNLSEAHIVIIISPEYNWSTTPEILNLLHVLPVKEIPSLLNNKVFSFIGVSTGKGGRAPAVHLMQIVNKLISFAGFQSIVSPMIFESHFTKEVLDEQGNSLQNKEYDSGLMKYCNYTVAIAERWFK